MRRGKSRDSLRLTTWMTTHSSGRKLVACRTWELWEEHRPEPTELTISGKLWACHTQRWVATPLTHFFGLRVLGCKTSEHSEAKAALQLRLTTVARLSGRLLSQVTPTITASSGPKRVACNRLIHPPQSAASRLRSAPRELLSDTGSSHPPFDPSVLFAHPRESLRVSDRWATRRTSLLGSANRCRS